MALFMVALLKKPTKKDEENGIEEGLLMPPTPVVAKDDKAAAIKAVIKNRDTLGDADLASVEVLVRPF